MNLATYDLMENPKYSDILQTIREAATESGKGNIMNSTTADQTSRGKLKLNKITTIDPELNLDELDAAVNEAYDKEGNDSDEERHGKQNKSNGAMMQESIDGMDEKDLEVEEMGDKEDWNNIEEGSLQVISIDEDNKL